MKPRYGSIAIAVLQTIVSLEIVGSAAWFAGDAVRAWRRNGRDLKEGRAPSGQVHWATRVEAPQLDFERVELGRDAQVQLLYGSRFTVGRPLFELSGVRAALDGDANFAVSSPRGAMDVRTSAGHAWLAPGTYSIMCEPGCKAMLVYVEKGVASIRGDSSRTEVALHDGEIGVVPRGREGRKIDRKTAEAYYLAEWGMTP